MPEKSKQVLEKARSVTPNNQNNRKVTTSAFKTDPKKIDQGGTCNTDISTAVSANHSVLSKPPSP